MTPGTVAAVASLIAELLAAGITISDILGQVKSKVPPEVWDGIIAEMDSGEARWK